MQNVIPWGQGACHHTAFTVVRQEGLLFHTHPAQDSRRLEEGAWGLLQGTRQHGALGPQTAETRISFPQARPSTPRDQRPLPPTGCESAHSYVGRFGAEEEAI